MSHARSEYEDFKTLAPEAFDLVMALGRAAAKAGLDKSLLELIKLLRSITCATGKPGGRPGVSGERAWRAGCDGGR